MQEETKIDQRTSVVIPSLCFWAMNFYSLVREVYRNAAPNSYSALNSSISFLF